VARTKKEFIRALAEFLAANSAEMSLKLAYGDTEAKRWVALRDATPVFGWVSVDETEAVLREWLAVKESLPRGTLKGGVLRCPHGHDGPFRYVEEVTEWRTVEGIEQTPGVGGTWLNIDSNAQQYDDSGDDPRLECRHEDHEDAAGGRLCLTEFEIPDELQIDWV
jgi:hypothetical protein